jgi:hypothetical protein
LLATAKKLKASFVFHCIFSPDPSRRTWRFPWAFGLQTLKQEDVSLRIWGLIIAGETISFHSQETMSELNLKEQLD